MFLVLLFIDIFTFAFYLYLPAISLPMSSFSVFFWAGGGEGGQEPAHIPRYFSVTVLCTARAGMKKQQDSTAVEYLLHAQHPQASFT